MTRQMARMALAAAVVFATTMAFCAEPGQATAYHCRLLGQAPEIDGLIGDDPAWGDVPKATGFTNLAAHAPSEKQTSFQIGFTPQALYIAVVCDEPNPDAIEANMADGEPLWDEDSVELFFSTDGRNEYQFVVNPMGSRSSPVTLRRWEAMAYLDEGAWSVEIALPWEVMGAFPDEGTTWGLNICRNIPIEDGMEHSTWAPVEDGFHEPQNFAPLAFDKVAPNIRGLIEATIAENAIRQETLITVSPKRGIFMRKEAGEERLAFNDADYLEPRLSPDGNTVAFTSREGGALGIWTVDVASAEKRRLCYGTQACWSPNGEGLVLERGGRIFTHDLNSGEERAISQDGNLQLMFPECLPDGRVACLDQTQQQIYILSGEPAPAQPLGLPGYLEGPLRASPDGKFLAIAKDGHICAMDIAQGHWRQLTFEPGAQRNPVWATDSRSICYAHTASSSAEEWSIHHVSLDDLHTVNRVENSVRANFDWRGTSPEPSKTFHIAGRALACWQGKKIPKRKAARGPAHWRGWDAIPPEAASKEEAKAIALENDWLTLALSKENMFIVLKPGGEREDVLSLRLTASNGKALSVQSLSPPSFDGEKVRAKVHLAGGNVLSVAVPRLRPVVEFKALEAGIQMDILAPMAAALIPDRLADDFILLPEDVAPGKMALLPASPVMLACLEAPRATLLAITPDAGQAGAVSRAAGGPLTEFRLSLGDQAAFLAFLAGEDTWQIAPAKKPERGEGWQVEWDKPFNAIWRMAARGEQQTFSRTWDMDALLPLGREPLPIECPDTMAPGRVLMYLWARERVTDPAILTPDDIVRDALGMVVYGRLLDNEGVRGYRAAASPVPFPEVTNRDPGWEPWLAHQQGYWFGVLDILKGVFTSATPGVLAYVEHMGGDAIAILEGFDARIAEYQAALPRIAAIAREAAKAPGLAEAAATLDEAATRGEALPVSNLEEARHALADLLAIVDPNLVEREEVDVICRREEFRTFYTLCRKAMEERQALVGTYRSAVKMANGRAAWAIIQDPGAKPVADNVREECRQLLRLRHYLEDDWRGERPLD